MIEYLNGAIRESIERAQALKKKFPRAADSSIYFEQLITKAQNKIGQIHNELSSLFFDQDYSKPDNLKKKFTRFKTIVAELQLLENMVVAAISRKHKDDDYLNLLARKICAEIGYPVQPPVISCLSQVYYGINTSYNLISMPLLESDFLLHLPDLYHELGHPLLVGTDPQTLPMRNQLGRLIKEVKVHFDEDIKRVTIVDHSWEAVNFRYNWRDSWVKNWSHEFFCDLFATYTLGPAYVWSNLHMCAKMDWQVFNIPLTKTSSHPPADARMKAMFHTLDMLGCREEKELIEEKWNEFISMLNVSTNEDYHIAIQDKFLKRSAELAIEGCQQMGCISTIGNDKAAISGILNVIWLKFWQNPTEFSDIEKKSVELLKQHLK